MNKKKSMKERKETDHKVFLFCHTVERRWNVTIHTLQALNMREAGDNLKMLRKQSIIWSEDRTYTKSQKVLRLLYNKTSFMDCTSEIEGYCITISFFNAQKRKPA